jgi:hypothetical protein
MSVTVAGLSLTCDVSNVLVLTGTIPSGKYDNYNVTIMDAPGLPNATVKSYSANKITTNIACDFRTYTPSTGVSVILSPPSPMPPILMYILLVLITWFIIWGIDLV